MTITYCFDTRGGFYAKSVSDKGVMVEYAYPSSEHATKARTNPLLVAECMVGMQDDLAYYASRPWYAERIERMSAQMAEILAPVQFLENSAK